MFHNYYLCIPLFNISGERNYSGQPQPRRVGGGLSTSVPSSNRTNGFSVYCSPMVLPIARQGVRLTFSSHQLQQAVSIYKPFRLLAWRLSHEIASPIFYLICASITHIGRFRQSRIPSHINLLEKA